MKSMKSLSMNKMLGKIQRRTTTDNISGSSSSPAVQAPTDGPPEKIIVGAIRQFCEPGGPSSTSGDEVILLPTIVEAAESSPPAAAEAARTLRKFLAREFASHASQQYNAIMVIRILADNPGPQFTKNLDKKFADAAKELLRTGRDPSVITLLSETLENFETTKQDDAGLKSLIDMWKKEKERGNRRVVNQQRTPSAPATSRGASSQDYWSRSHSNKRLPDPVELANRLEEARTSAKLLQQSVSCTPPQDLLTNELIREFADRCQSASRSIQAYMIADNPAPDNSTMESLLDTNEQLQTSLNQHQRAVLGARKVMGIGQQASPAPLASNPPGVRTDSKLPGAAAADGAGLGIKLNNNGGNSSHSTPPAPVPAREAPQTTEYFKPPPGPPPKVAATEEDPFKDPTDERPAAEIYSGTRKLPPQHASDDEDDDLYGSPARPAKPRQDPGETMLRY